MMTMGDDDAVDSVDFRGFRAQLKKPAQTLQNHPEGARKKLSLSNRREGLA